MLCEVQWLEARTQVNQSHGTQVVMVLSVLQQGITLAHDAVK